MQGEGQKHDIFWSSFSHLWDSHFKASISHTPLDHECLHIHLQPTHLECAPRSCISSQSILALCMLTQFCSSLVVFIWNWCNKHVWIRISFLMQNSCDHGYNHAEQNHWWIITSNPKERFGFIRSPKLCRNDWPRAWDLVSDKTILVARRWPMGEKTQQSLLIILIPMMSCFSLSIKWWKWYRPLDSR